MYQTAEESRQGVPKEGEKISVAKQFTGRNIPAKPVHCALRIEGRLETRNA